MMFCVPCRVEMPCTKNGLGVRFPVDHAYPGDKYTCPKCGTEVIRTNASAVFDPDHHVKTIDAYQKGEDHEHENDADR